MMRPAELIAFEDDIAKEFEAGHIAAPIHLSGGNETQLLDYFSEHVQPHHWIFCSWRSHFHCLLHGVPSAEVKQAIMDGRSISLCFPEYRVFSSGIVGGIAPIALGVAQSIQWTEDDTNPSRVHVFLGDMSVKAGIVRECMEYSMRHRLPVNFIIEDNGVSICTPTKESWGPHDWFYSANMNTHTYKYEMTRRHVGVDKWVKF